MIKQGSDDETSRQHKERLQQKITTAAQIFLAKNTLLLLEDRNQFLTNIHVKGKVRRGTKLEILGKARVMSYEDLEKARAERAVKEAKKVATVGKGKRGRKRHNPAMVSENVYNLDETGVCSGLSQRSCQ